MQQEISNDCDFFERQNKKNSMQKNGNTEKNKQLTLFDCDWLGWIAGDSGSIKGECEWLLCAYVKWCVDSLFVDVGRYDENWGFVPCLGV